MSIENYLNEESINNLFNNKEYDNSVICETNPNLKNDSDEMVGKILLMINTKKKTLKKNGRVTFSGRRIKWRSSMKDGRCVVVVPSFWAKPYMHDIKLKVKVKILKSRLVNDERVYYEDYEELELTKSQYIQRRIFEKAGDYQYKFMKAYENFNARNFQIKDYYRALNETSKHYMISHDDLKKLISNLNHLKKKIKKEWDEYLFTHYQNNVEDRLIDEMFTEKSDENNVIDMTKRV